GARWHSRRQLPRGCPDHGAAAQQAGTLGQLGQHRSGGDWHSLSVRHLLQPMLGFTTRRTIMNANVRWAVLGLAAVFNSAGTVRGATWYVATNGSDLGPGTQAQPFQHVEQAVAASANGDAIIVGNGNYQGITNTGFAINKAVRIVSSGGAGNCAIDAQHQN